MTFGLCRSGFGNARRQFPGLRHGHLHHRLGRMRHHHRRDGTAKAADTHLFLAFGDFQFGYVGLLHQVDQCFQFSQIHD